MNRLSALPSIAAMRLAPWNTPISTYASPGPRQLAATLRSARLFSRARFSTSSARRGSSARKRSESTALQVARHAGQARLVGRRLVPRVRVPSVVEVARERRELERPERVAHDRELGGLRDPEGLLREPGLRPMR